MTSHSKHQRSGATQYLLVAYILLVLLAVGGMLTPTGASTPGQDATKTQFFEAIDNDEDLQARFHTADNSLVWSQDGTQYRAQAIPAFDPERYDQVTTVSGESTSIPWVIWSYVGIFAGVLVLFSPLPIIGDLLTRVGYGRQQHTVLWLLGLLVLPVVAVPLYLARTRTLYRRTIVAFAVLTFFAVVAAGYLGGSVEVDISEQAPPSVQ